METVNKGPTPWPRSLRKSGFIGIFPQCSDAAGIAAEAAGNLNLALAHEPFVIFLEVVGQVAIADRYPK